jgi:hypothetical protein
MQHFLNLEKCTCGAYRYLAVREHKKSYEIYLIHHRHFGAGQNIRKYSKLASIPKFRVNIHDKRIDQEFQDKKIKLTGQQVSVLRSVLTQLEGPNHPQKEITESPESLREAPEDLGPLVGGSVALESMTS